MEFLAIALFAIFCVWCCVIPLVLAGEAAVRRRELAEKERIKKLQS